VSDIMWRNPDLEQHTIAVCDLVSALQTHSAADLTAYCTGADHVSQLISSLLAALTAHTHCGADTKDTKVVLSVLNSLIDLVSSPKSGVLVSCMVNAGIVGMLLSCMEAHSHDRALVGACLMLIANIMDDTTQGFPVGSNACVKVAADELVAQKHVLGSVCYIHANDDAAVAQGKCVARGICKHVDNSTQLLEEPITTIDKLLKVQTYSHFPFQFVRCALHVPTFPPPPHTHTPYTHTLCSSTLLLPGQSKHAAVIRCGWRVGRRRGRSRCSQD
jgi:hypothetical protein